MSLLDRALDASVFFSFDRSGFERHARRFVPGDVKVSMTGKSVVVTGANSGIGFAVARSLAALGATVHLVCRNPTRGAEALATLNAEFPSAKLILHQLDVSSLPAVKRFCELFKGPVDVLINNAGVLLGAPARTAEGHELTYATNVLGPFVLTSGLMPKLIVAKGRVITVSSGGMLLTKLSLPVLQGQVEKFDGVVAYAQTKRAEVILSELWAARQPEVTFASMHPGWADTPGVSGSLPTFYDMMKERLRTAAQGADTVTWLAVAPRLGSTSGLFWFDRAPAATHPLRWTRESPEDRDALFLACETQSK